jgi:hypothetical protein
MTRVTPCAATDFHASNLSMLKWGAMKKRILAMGLGILLGAGGTHATLASLQPAADAFHFPLLNPQHENMQRLLINAMGYLKPGHALVDPASGYPVEGWNEDPALGLYLRSFTQLTAIGERIELLANIAAGYAVNPYLSRERALLDLAVILSSLLSDQSNPKLSADGLLVNFLGFDSTGRIGPLSEEVEKQAFITAFGAEQATLVWDALAIRGWILPQQDGSFAKISRKGEYGEQYFTRELAPFASNEIRAKIMALLDRRDVQIIFGDNANLTASAAKAVGALLHSSLESDPQVAEVRDNLELFIARQNAGYRHLYDKDSGLFFFGWNATNNRFTGWEDSNGKWIVGHMDYFVNEFRGPLIFVVRRFGLPTDAIKNSGFKIKPYRMAEGHDLYSLATWNGSAFESLGLSLFMQELDSPGWRESLENAVAIEIDYATRHELPGFLSEAYSGNGVEYTGTIGIADIAVTDQPRITDAPSLYTLGTAYRIAPESIEKFLGKHRKIIESLFTDHGPWEGYNTTRQKAIEYQTTGHTLALILGGISSAEKNMRRYLAWRDVEAIPRIQRSDPSAIDFLAEPVEWIPWSPTGDQLHAARSENEFLIRAAAVRDGAVTVKLPGDTGANLSDGALLIRYRAATPLEAVMTLAGGPTVFPNEINLRFNAAEAENGIRIPLPQTPGLESVSELVIRVGDRRAPLPVDLVISGFEFEPAM